MIRSLISAAVWFRVLVVLAGACLLVGGIFAMSKAPVDLLPEFSAPTVEIQTESLGLSAQEVEQLITVPMEQDLLSGILGVNTIRSHSTPGVSTIELVFDRGTNLLDDRELVQERVSQAVALPNVSRPPVMLEPVSSTNRVMSVALSSQKLSPIQLGVLARWTIRPRLIGLPGVSNVAIWGLRDRQLQVLVDPHRLAARGVTLDKVIRTAGNAQMVSPLSFLNASTPGTGGFVEGPTQRLSVLHELPFGTPADLAKVPIEGGAPGRRLLLGDVAKVVEGNQPLIGDALVGGRTGVLLSIEKLPGANTVSVTREVKDALGDMGPGLDGVQVNTSVFRPADYVEHGMSNVGLALAIAGALLLLAAAAYFLRWRAVVAVAVSVPLSVVTAVLVVHLLGYTVNALVLLGLLMAVSVIVDDAVASGHAIAARMARARESARGERGSVATTVIEALSELRGPLGYATLIVLLVAVPVFFAPGLDGAFVHPIAVSFVAGVLASSAVALTVSPALAVLLHRRSVGPGRRALGGRIARTYAAALSAVVRFRGAVLAVCALGALALVAIPFLNAPERPSFKDRALVVRWGAPPGTSLPKMDRATARASAQLRALPGVESVSSDVGRAVLGDRVVDVNSSQAWVRMDPDADYGRTRASVERAVSATPGLRGTVETYEDASSRDVLKQTPRQVTVRVYGQDYGVMSRKARELSAVMAKVDGVGTPRTTLPVDQPGLNVRVSLAGAQRHGVLPSEVRRQVGTIVSGITVGSLFQDQKVFDVVVRGVPATQRSVKAVQSLVIDAPGGRHIPLSQLADVSVKRSPADIVHEDVSRYVDVTAPVSGRDEGSVRSDISGRIETVSFPRDYHATVLSPGGSGGGGHLQF